MVKQIEIPEKDGFKIGEVAKLLGLESYVLRYWETEFKALKPKKTRSGQRLYTRNDIELLVRIQSLLHEELYTIAGARRQLEMHGMEAPILASADDTAQMNALNESLAEHQANEEALRVELEIARAELELMEQEHTTLLEQHEGLLASSTRLEREIDDLSRIAAEKEASLAQAQQLHAQVDQGWDVFKQEQHDHVAHLEQTLAALEQEHAALTASFESLKAQYGELQQAQQQTNTEQDDVKHLLAAQEQARATTFASLRHQLESLIHLTAPAA